MDHSVNVLQFADARASEIGTLMYETSKLPKKKKTYFQRLPNHMRRRGASQNPKRVPRKLRESNQAQTVKTLQKKIHKKKPKDLQKEYAGRNKPGNIWLNNHIWFARRFKMDTLWGYRLPIHSNDKKLGFSHISVEHYAMLQDISYYCCIQLEGTLEKLLPELELLTDNSSDVFSSEIFLEGTKEGHCILYYTKNYPFKAIGPVSFFWRPTYKEKRPLQRQLWIWCHPSCKEELVQVLAELFCLTEIKASDSKSANDVSSNEACSETLFSETVFKSEYVRMMVLRSLVRYRLIGYKAQTILTNALNLADFTDKLDIDNEPSEKRLKLDDQEDNSKTWWESYYNNIQHIDFHMKKGELLDLLQYHCSRSFVTPGSIIGLTVKDPRIHLQITNCEAEKEKRDENDFKLFEDLEKSFTPEIADCALWDKDIRNEVNATKISTKEINEERSKQIVTESLGKKENRVPILIIHQSNGNGFSGGWDLIAPAGWSREFWHLLLQKGARPTGLRDLHFINLEAGCPNFPCSFPDTTAGLPKNEVLSDATSAKFYVLRKGIRAMNEICCSHNMGKKLSDKHRDKLLELFNILVKSFNPAMQVYKSLILVRLLCLNKGAPSKHAGIYLLNEQDMEDVKSMKAFMGPTEPKHCIEKKNKVLSSGKVQSLERPEIQTLISNSSRKMIGYISEGGYSRLEGKGCAIGHCTTLGFLSMAKKCFEGNLKPLVLIREQNNFTYRLASIEVIENRKIIYSI
ncbi:hypothetical protein CDAR_251731 [Caerostris darwini]|uniref:Uncharacterized protein n=1 Tax=Caerostris darwini TaxID=1538125 RepID=A0AAV4U178_9ARAC|nr:hypothetical protein CDAR_251731 [Caerostris darwini]